MKSSKIFKVSLILRTLPNFLVFWDLDFFRRSFDYLLSVMNLFEQYQSNMKSPKFFTLPNIFSTFGFGFFRISFDHILSVMNLFKQYPIHMKSPYFLKSLKKRRNGWVQRMSRMDSSHSL